MREALGRLIDAEPDLDLCASTADAGETIEAIEHFEPDVLILSPYLPGQSGFELLREIRGMQPALSVVIFSPQSDSVQAAESIRAGAKGYVAKQEEGPTIIAAIKRVAEGRIWVSKDFMPDLLDRYFARELSHENIKDTLTKRELQIFEMMGKGITTRQIAEYLFISQRTVESHRDHIRAKLKVDDVFKLHQVAFEWVREEIALGR